MVRCSVCALHGGIRGVACKEEALPTGLTRAVNN